MSGQDERLRAHMAEAEAGRLIWRGLAIVAVLLAAIGLGHKAGLALVVAAVFWLGRPGPSPELDKATRRG